jgi:glycosyltransferase involved in cell wall biosynthesis
MTWENSYPEGAEEIEGTRILRFSVQHPRDVASFNKYSEYVASRIGNLTLDEQEKWMRLQGPDCPHLLSYLEHNRETYDLFIFYPYLYATTYYGLQKVSGKSLLAPLAHDEWPIYLDIWDHFFNLPKGFIFNTPEERDFLRFRFRNSRLDGPVIGVGVDPPESISPQRFEQKYGIDQPFMLYVGRIDESKGCGELFEYFIHLRKEDYKPRKLVLLGKAVMDIPNHPDIIHLGFLPEQDKWDCMAAAQFLVNPSPHESLSIVLLEAWWTGTPVLVTAKSKVMVGQCLRSNGGLFYDGYQEFALLVDYYNNNEDVRITLGRQGANFVYPQYSWVNIRKEYLNAAKLIG